MRLLDYFRASLCTSVVFHNVQHLLSAHIARSKERVKGDWAFMYPDGDCEGEVSVRNSGAQVLT